MEFLKTIAGKIVSGLVAVAVIAAAVSLWRMDPSERHSLTAGTGKVMAWFLIVLVIPWVSFSIVRSVAKMDSNLAGGVLVSAYTVLEAIVLIWLFNWHVAGAT